MRGLPYPAYRRAARAEAWRRTLQFSRRLALGTWIALPTLAAVIAGLIAVAGGQSVGWSALIGVGSTVIAGGLWFGARYAWCYFIEFPAQNFERASRLDAILVRNKERMGLYLQLYDLRTRVNEICKLALVPNDDPKANLLATGRELGFLLDAVADVLRQHGEDESAEKSVAMKADVASDFAGDPKNLVGRYGFLGRTKDWLDELMRPGGPLFSARLAEITSPGITVSGHNLSDSL